MASQQVISIVRKSSLIIDNSELLCFYNLIPYEFFLLSEDRYAHV